VPLTPLPASNTKRYFIHWTIGGTSHHTQIRVLDSVTDGAAITALQDDFSLLLGALGSNVVLDQLLVADNGSDIRNPVSGWSTLTGTASPVSGQDLARTFSLRGRSSSGRKTKMLLWGLTTGEQPDFQLALADQPAEQSDFMSAVAARSNMYLAIDGTVPVYRTDYLEDYNDHWQKELRP